MDWIIAFVTVILLLAYIFLRRKDQISADAAAAHIRNGALLIDVRSPAEFSTGHVKGAVNIPLPEIDSLIGTKVPDKDQVILVHCQSGARSSTAKNQLSALGYTHVYNLGTYQRAEHIVERE